MNCIEFPLISVIVPVYNSEHCIKDCVMSILNQNYPRVQVVIVDDGSIDQSYSICKEIMYSDDRIRLLRQKNKGVSSARNYGLREANGDLIAFCDSDDRLLPNFLSTLYNNMRVHSADLSCCMYCKSTDFEEIYKEEESQKCAPLVLEKEQAIVKVISESDGYIWDKLYKASIISNQLFSSEITIHEDELFVLQYMLKCKTVVFSNQELYWYYDNPRGTVNNKKTTNKSFTSIVAKEQILALLGDEQIDEAVQHKVWNELMKLYSIGYKKLLFKYEKDLGEIRNNILHGFCAHQGEYSLDASWNIKELVYYFILFIRVYILSGRKSDVYK